MSTQAAADRLGLSIATVQKYRKLAGYFATNAEQLDASIRQCAAEGLTREETATKLRIAARLIGNFGRRHKIKFRHASEGVGVDRSRAEVMASMYKSGKTLEQIGQAYGISRERVRQIITKYHGMTAESGGLHVRAKQRSAAALARKEAKYREKYGCSFAQWQQLCDVNREMRSAGSGRYQVPTYAFVSQRNNARRRGIGWDLTLLDWWSIWQGSGKWELRGRGKGYMMCRFGDEGAYALGNVYIATGVHNGAVQPNNPYRLNHPRHAEVIEQRRAAA